MQTEYTEWASIQGKDAPEKMTCMSNSKEWNLALNLIEYCPKKMHDYFSNEK